jgi:hypothetical protein
MFSCLYLAFDLRFFGLKTLALQDLGLTSPIRYTARQTDKNPKEDPTQRRIDTCMAIELVFMNSPILFFNPILLAKPSFFKIL